MIDFFSENSVLQVDEESRLSVLARLFFLTLPWLRLIGNAQGKNKNKTLPFKKQLLRQLKSKDLMHEIKNWNLCSCFSHVNFRMLRLNKIQRPI